MYFEEITEDVIYTSRPRIITPTDVELFASNSWATNPLFLSREAAAQAGFGDRIVPGALIISFSLGLLYQLGLFDHITALTELNAKFVGPIMPGEAIQVEARLSSKRELDEERGLVQLTARCRNVSRGKEAVIMSMTLIYKKKKI